MRNDIDPDRIPPIFLANGNWTPQRGVYAATMCLFSGVLFFIPIVILISQLARSYKHAKLRNASYGATYPLCAATMASLAARARMHVWWGRLLNSLHGLNPYVAGLSARDYVYFCNATGFDNPFKNLHSRCTVYFELNYAVSIIETLQEKMNKG